MDSQNSMDIEEDTPNAPPGVPPSADDAVAAMVSLSSRPCITARDSIVSVNVKNANKRELDDSRSTSSVKKPASIDPMSSNNPPESGQGGTLLFPLPSAAPTVVSHRYSKDQPPFVVQVQSTQESGTSHPLHISRVIPQIFPRNILEIKKAGRNKILVQINTYEAANRLVSNNSLTSHNLRAFTLHTRFLEQASLEMFPKIYPLNSLENPSPPQLKY